MECELSHLADDSRFDQVSHETDHEAEVYSHLLYQPLIASNSDTDSHPEHDSDSSHHGCSLW